MYALGQRWFTFVFRPQYSLFIHQYGSFTLWMLFDDITFFYLLLMFVTILMHFFIVKESSLFPLKHQYSNYVPTISQGCCTMRTTLTSFHIWTDAKVFRQLVNLDFLTWCESSEIVYFLLFNITRYYMMCFRYVLNPHSRKFCGLVVLPCLDQ